MTSIRLTQTSVGQSVTNKRAAGYALIDSALDYFRGLREHTLRKKPSTAELVNWMTLVLACGAHLDQRLAHQEPILGHSLSALVKTQEDLDEIGRFNSQYLRAQGNSD